MFSSVVRLLCLYSFSSGPSTTNALHLLQVGLFHFCDDEFEQRSPGSLHFRSFLALPNEPVQLVHDRVHEQLPVLRVETNSLRVPAKLRPNCSKLIGCLDTDYGMNNKGKLTRLRASPGLDIRASLDFLKTKRTRRPSHFLVVCLLYVIHAQIFLRRNCFIHEFRSQE